MPIRVCTGSPTCPNPAVYRGRCQEHARKRDREINRAGYHIYRTKRWKHTRERVLADKPLCAECLREGKDAIATDVDHIVALVAGGDPWHPSNLQSLCRRHHSRKTQAERA